MRTETGRREALKIVDRWASWIEDVSADMDAPALDENRAKFRREHEQVRRTLSEPAMPTVPKDLAQDTIDAIDDLMGEATNSRPVQDWGRVNDVLVRMQAIVNEAKQ